MKTSKARRLSGTTARTVELQATEALAFLHSSGLGHGDFRPSNLLFQVKDISQWSNEDIQHRLGDVIEEAVLYRDGTPTTEPGVPPTVICPTDYTTLVPDHLEKFVYLVDLGESFRFSTPPTNGLGFGLHHFRNQSRVSAFRDIHGRVRRRGSPTDCDDSGKNARPLVEDGKPVGDGMLDRVTIEANLKEIGEADSWNDSSNKKGGILCQEEVDDLADLLGRMLKYQPSERIDIRSVLQHKWFTKEYEDNK
ncbi:hypothetical protein B0O99DRAFT_725635 [Bisporella sp. PMI_857]|nr:hypothetical protein B0O99DRAFT_725635 [Bisporella sp. PMI_857]